MALISNAVRGWVFVFPKTTQCFLTTLSATMEVGKKTESAEKWRVPLLQVNRADADKG